jgi:hypothetical protein
MNPDAAFVELAEAKRAVRASRRAFVKSADSTFVRAMKGVIGQYLEARRQGVSREDGIKGIELELRAAWPKAVSKFTVDCSACDDTGYVEHTCWDQHRCGRQVCARNPERQHAYVEPCHCPKGDRKRKRAPQQATDIAAAVKTQRKRGGFARIGS